MPRITPVSFIYITKCTFQEDEEDLDAVEEDEGEEEEETPGEEKPEDTKVS